MRLWRSAAILQTGASDRLRVSLAAAEQGFELKGKRLLRADLAGLPDALAEEPGAIVSGGIGFVRRGLSLQGAEIPDFPDYPPSLLPFLGRDVRRGTLREALALPDGTAFVKPADATKLFTGFVVEGVPSTYAVSGLPMDTPVWISGRVDFLSEWRCYVVEGEIERAGHYRGDPLLFPDPALPRAALAAMQRAGEAPVSFVLDVGVAATGGTLVVEANDGYSVGNYALSPLQYAHLLETRWDEMVATPDFSLEL